jgi:WD40 repeat protein
MNIKVYAFTFSIITFLCNCMKNIPQEKIIKEITVIQQPIKAQYVKKDRVIMVGKDRCSIVNPDTNQEVIKIGNDSYENFSLDFSLSADKKKVALSYKKNIKIYDTDTGNEIWSHHNNDYIHSPTFSSLEPFIILFNGYNEHKKITKHNYITNQNETYNVPYLYEDVALHPTQNIMCAGNNNKIVIYSLDNLKEPLKQGKLKNTLPEHYQYSHDGSFMVAAGLFDIYIIDNSLTNLFSCFRAKNINGEFYTTVLNADSTILAVLSKQVDGSYVIRYYDIATKKCIYLAIIEKKYGVCPTNLSFSPDETELMIVLNDKCVIVPVPFEVNKKNLLFVYWILKNYQNSNPEISDDVIGYIINTFFG